jgi:hypothetical protein
MVKVSLLCENYPGPVKMEHSQFIFSRVNYGLEAVIIMYFLLLVYHKKILEMGMHIIYTSTKCHSQIPLS